MNTSVNSQGKSGNINSLWLENDSTEFTILTKSTIRNLEGPTQRMKQDLFAT